MDITERKRAEGALRARELNLRLILDSIPAPAALMTASGEVETVNKPNLEYFGKTLEDLKKRRPATRFIQMTFPHAIEIWIEATQSGQPYDVKQRLRRFDGVYRWFGVRGFPLRDPDGRILNWCVLLTDIDDRERAEEALRVVVETAIDAVVSADENGAIEFANPATTRVFGYDPAELIGKPLTVLMPQFMRKLHERCVQTIPGYWPAAYQLASYRVHWPAQEWTGVSAGSLVRRNRHRKRAHFYGLHPGCQRTEESGREPSTQRATLAGCLREFSDRRGPHGHDRTLRGDQFRLSADAGTLRRRTEKADVSELTLEDDHRENRALVAELIDGKRSQFQIEKRYRRKDGRLIWVSNNVSLVPGTEDSLGL